MEQPRTPLIPETDWRYQKWGNYELVDTIVKSKKFFPTWITGLSGNGKTQMVEQACAENKREFIRVNFTVETDEKDLLGGFRLENGDTVFHEGPAVEAMRHGAVLLLDEIDAGHTNKILSLQSILEGKGVLIKATGEWVKPADGFQVFATSNTKGRGSEDGTFIGTNIMNGAFLDRFVGMICQEYPPADVEMNIIKSYYANYVWEGREKSDITKEEVKNATNFMTKLVEWAGNIRTAHEDGSVTSVITTRSLIAIIQSYAIFGDKMKAIKFACSRFDDVTAEGFIELYMNIDEAVKYEGERKSKDKK